MNRHRQSGLLATFLISLVFAPVCLAQLDTLSDLLPLALGKEWEYDFRVSSTSLMYETRDEGRATYRVIDSTPSADSIRWKLFERRNFTRSILEHGILYSATPTSDSTTIEFAEITSGHHRLLAPQGAYAGNVFPFWDLILWGDSIQYFRFALTDPTGIRWDSSCACKYYHTIRRSITFQKNVGIVRSVGWESANPNAKYWRYALISPSAVAIERGEVPATTRLYQNYPNPFNPSTSISYKLSARSQVVLAVFNTLGEEIALLQAGEQDAGYHEVKFDASGLASGVYLYRLQAGDIAQTRKLLLVK